jgi:adenylate cyclase
VVLAQLLEHLAAAGGVCVQGSIYEAVPGRLPFDYGSLGEREVKGFEEPVRACSVTLTPGGSLPSPSERSAQRARRSFKRVGWIGAVIVGAFVAIFLVWNLRPEPRIGKPVIAVLPFENLSGDQSEDYFSNGLTEDLITRLSRFTQFAVIARHSTAQFKDRTLDIKEIGGALGARFVVQGSVRKAQERLRISIQLIDAEDGTHLWVQSYDRDLSVAEIFDIQDEVTRQVATTIADDWGVLRRVEFEEVRGKRPENLDSYECVLRIYSFYATYSPKVHESVRACAENAVELDPGYARAWAVLAWLALDEHRLGINKKPGSLDRALKYARRAVELDEDYENGRSALAQVYAARHELDAFFAEADRAVATNPGNASVLAGLGIWLALAGKIDRAEELLTRAVALNPRYPDWYNFGLFVVNYERRNYQAALDAMLKVKAKDLSFTMRNIAAAYGQLGRVEEGRAVVSRLLKMYPTFAESVRQVAREHNMSPEMVNHLVAGLRKAGLQVPDE